jgi:hypothetical protein
MTAKVFSITAERDSAIREAKALVQDFYDKYEPEIASLIERMLEDGAKLVGTAGGRVHEDGSFERDPYNEADLIELIIQMFSGAQIWLIKGTTGFDDEEARSVFLRLFARDFGV